MAKCNAAALKKQFHFREFCSVLLLNLVYFAINYCMHPHTCHTKRMKERETVEKCPGFGQIKRNLAEKQQVYFNTAKCLLHISPCVCFAREPGLRRDWSINNNQHDGCWSPNHRWT